MENSNINSKEEQARNNLESFVRDNKIFIDTCSLLHSEVDKFWVNIIPMLKKYNSKIIIAIRVYEEVEKHCENTENNQLATKAKTCKKILNQRKRTIAGTAQ